MERTGPVKATEACTGQIYPTVNIQKLNSVSRQFIDEDTTKCSPKDIK
jgi:hypothetical protein